MVGLSHGKVSTWGMKITLLVGGQRYLNITGRPNIAAGTGRCYFQIFGTWYSNTSIESCKKQRNKGNKEMGKRK